MGARKVVTTVRNAVVSEVAVESTDADGIGVHIDLGTDTATATFNTRPAAQTVDLGDGLSMDLDAAGCLVRLDVADYGKYRPGFGPPMHP